MVCVCESSNYKTVAERLRQAVRGVLECNILLDNPLFSLADCRQFDCVVSNCMLESASRDRATYEQCVRTVFGLVKPGGRVIIEGVTHNSEYGFGSEKHKVFAYDIPLAEEAFKKAGFRNVTIHENRNLWSEDMQSIAFYLLAVKTGPLQ